MNSISYKINEVFQSIQGEGAHTGVPAIFIRLQGCPVGCAWCDTKHTWEVGLDKLADVDQVMAEQTESEHWFEATTEQLLALYQQQGYTAQHMIVTGGEPCIYDLTELTNGLIAEGFSVQIETSGTFDIHCHPSTWVTVSPKIGMRGGYKLLTSVLKRADEIKHPVAMEKHIQDLKGLLQLLDGTKQPLIYLQPISQQQRATELAIESCIKENWRLSLQTHKFIGIE